MSVRIKILVGFGLLLLMLLATGVKDMLVLRYLQKDVDYIAQQQIPAIIAAENIVNALDSTSLITAEALILVDKTKIPAKLAEASVNRKVASEGYSTLEKLLADDKGKNLLQQVQTLRKNYTEGRNKVLKLLEAGADQQTLDVTFSRDLAPQREAYRAKLLELVQHLTNQSQQVANEVAHDVQTIFWITIALGSIGTAISFGAATWVSRSIAHSLQVAVRCAEKIAEGDLTQHFGIIDGKDEIGRLLQAMQRMQAGLRKMFSDIRTHADALGTASEQLASASLQVKGSASQQSYAATNMASGMEQLASSINQLAESAEHGYHTANESGSLCENGTNIIQSATREMQTLAETVQATADTLVALDTHSAKIGTIVDTIREVTDQINLLALNAAIEAARAGESGRGFAVVADEVRKLAERTASSTSEIGQMMEGMQLTAHTAVQQMETAVQRAQAGLTLANDAGGAILTINTSVKDNANMVADISVTTRQQRSASHELATHIESVAHSAEENLASAAATADLAGSMRELAHDLQRMTQRFRLA